MISNPDPTMDGGNPNQLENLVETYTTEFSSLNTAMDEIDSYMDVLEQRTDSLYSDLTELLEDNKKTRLDVQTERLTDMPEKDVETGQSQTQEAKRHVAERVQEMPPSDDDERHGHQELAGEASVDRNGEAENKDIAPSTDESESVNKNRQ